MSAANHDFNIEQGADWTQNLLWKDSTGTPVNLSGYSALMQVRTSTEDTGTPVVTLSDGDGITLGGSAGTIVLALTAAQTAAIPCDGNRTYQYDLLMISGPGHAVRLIEGNFAVSAAVTVQ